MTASPESIDVIVPTTCERRRWSSLQRAISSITSQQDVTVRVLVVVNGDRYDTDCYDTLSGRGDVVVHYQQEGSLPLALRTGRSLVTAPFFAFLDDDDEYLAGGLAARLQPLLVDPGLAFTASRGVRREDGVDRAAPVRILPDGINANPLLSLTDENWLASCGGLYRTSSVPLDYFDGETKYFEWTYLAYKLALERRLLYVDQATFRINDSGDSLSKSTGYRLAEIEVLQKVRRLGLPGEVETEVRKRIGGAHHHLSHYFLEEGRLLWAWQHHLKSLLYPGGLRFLAYSRHLLFPLFHLVT